MRPEQQELQGPGAGSSRVGLRSTVKSTALLAVGGGMRGRPDLASGSPKGARLLG